MTAATDAATKNAAVVQDNCSLDRSHWTITPEKGDLYSIKSSVNGLCLSLDTVTGALVQQDCSQLSPGLWRFNLVSKIDPFTASNQIKTYEIRSAQTFFCTYIPNKATTPGTPLAQQKCLRESHHRWLLIGQLPATAESIDLNLLVVTKVASKIPNMVERTTTAEARAQQRYWSTNVMPAFFNYYTNGRVRLNVYYYESPYLLTSLADQYSVNPGDIPEDMDMILNPGWFDGVFINHAAPVDWGLVTFGVNIDGMQSAFSNAPIDDSSPLFFTEDLAQIGGMVHEFMHQLEYYIELMPARKKMTEHCAPTNNSMLDCGADEEEVGGYQENTDGLGHWLAFYRDFLNGYLWDGKAGLGEPVWASGLKPRDRDTPFIPGGPLSPRSNQSSCLNMDSIQGKYLQDKLNPNNHAWINNKNLSINWGDGFIFDGEDDYLRMANLANDNFTISMWIKSSQTFLGSNIAAKNTSLVYADVDPKIGESSSPRIFGYGQGFELRGVHTASGNDGLKFITNKLSTTANVDVTTGEWVHVAAVRNRNKGIISIYVNGQLVSSAQGDSKPLNGNPIVKIGSAFQYPKIGETTLVNDHFQGSMNDFCIFNSAMDEVAINQLITDHNNKTQPAHQEAFVSDLAIAQSTNGWGTIGIDKSIDGNALSIGEQTYTKGLGAHAPSSITYKLGGAAKRFQSDIGIDDEAKEHYSSAEFQVYADGVMIFRSGDKFDTDAPQSIDLDITGVNELKLVTTTGQDNSAYADHTDWGNAKIIFK